ncbi:MAG TPA: hypothetical protein DCS42_05700 [Nitrospiraceae bacterium]|nr:hypothetical protein [Nitrospiraceae bacterium]
MARLNFNGKAFTIIAVHAPPPVSSCKDGNEKTLGAIGSWIKNGKLKFNLGPGVKGDDVILLGDFNATAFSKGWSSFMKSGVRDAMRSGWRLKPTWAPFKSAPSIIRIDYVFVGNGFVPIAAYTIGIKDSDHRAVISDIQTRGVAGGDPE